MKILVISHNSFSKTSNMGKTLSSYFANVDYKDIAQFYIRPETPSRNPANPSDDICKNYYRITDKDIIRSIFTRNSGTVFFEKNLKAAPHVAKENAGLTLQMYQKGCQRKPYMYLLRNIWWNMGKWNTARLRTWLDDYNPDIVFFASGDYAFMYKIALSIAKSRNIPLVVSCMDDYYINHQNEESLLGQLAHNIFMRQVRKTMAYASCIYTICDKMAKDYSEYFSTPCHVLHTPSSIGEPLNAKKSNAISYIGNLGYNRNIQLANIGKALKALDLPGKPEFIDVYSPESRPEILSVFTEENGIKFHGGIPYDKVLEVIGSSLAVIHTESFETKYRKTVAYSVSTKIADSLASGTSILAYGPGEVASIEYLRNNDAAFCATDENLEATLRELITNESERANKISNALNLANKNHTSQKNCDMLENTMKEVLQNENITGELRI